VWTCRRQHWTRVRCRGQRGLDLTAVRPERQRVEIVDNRVVSFFSPVAWANQNAHDRDLGSTGPAIVRGLGRTWIFSDGKGGTAYLFDLVLLGGLGGEIATLHGCESYGGTAF